MGASNLFRQWSTWRDWYLLQPAGGDWLLPRRDDRRLSRGATKETDQRDKRLRQPAKYRRVRELPTLVALLFLTLKVSAKVFIDVSVFDCLFRWNPRVRRENSGTRLKGYSRIQTFLKLIFLPLDFNFLSRNYRVWLIYVLEYVPKYRSTGTIARCFTDFPIDITAKLRITYGDLQTYNIRLLITT